MRDVQGENEDKQTETTIVLFMPWMIIPPPTWNAYLVFLNAASGLQSRMIETGYCYNMCDEYEK
jgi:hypothetical protein